jgi:hypothetical protein
VHTHRLLSLAVPKPRPHTWNGVEQYGRHNNGQCQNLAYQAQSSNDKYSDVSANGCSQAVRPGPTLCRVVNDDELRRLLDRTREHNVTASRLTDAEFAALPDPHDVALKAILADDDHPDRPTLREYFAQVGNDRAANLLEGLVAQNRIDLSNPAMAGVVAAVWALTEPFAVGLDPTDWIAMFRSNGYTHDGQPSQSPTEPVLLYRGTVPNRQAGMAWSTDYKRAQEFACAGMSGRALGNIYRAVVEPGLLLAYIHDGLGRGESEYVVDQERLDPTSIELVARGEDVCPKLSLSQSLDPR